MADCAVADVVVALQQEGLPFQFQQRKQLTWESLIENCKEGVFVMRLSVRDGNTGLAGKHFVAVDCWRRIIIDNAESQPVEFTGCTARMLKRRIRCGSVLTALLGLTRLSTCSVK